MKPLALWSCACVVVLLSVVNAAPRSYRYDDYAKALRVKRQASTGTESTDTTIEDCKDDAEFDWPVECSTCPAYTVMSNDNYACLSCSQFCEECKQDPAVENEDGSMTYPSTTDCMKCMTGYLGVKELDSTTQTNKTVCYACASFCDGCVVKGECDSDKCRSKTTGQGTIFDETTKTCKSCASNCKACSIASECNSGSCMDGYAFESTTKTCTSCPDQCTACSYEGTTLKCTQCAAKYVTTSDETGCEACDDFCHECERVEGNVMCKSGQCFDRYVRDATTGSCDRCGDNCESCSSEGTCDEGTCLEGFGYVKNPDSNNGACNACPAKCASCTPDDSGNLNTCDQCMATYMLAEQPTCDYCPDKCHTCSISVNGDVQCKSTGCDNQYAFRSSDGTCHKCPDNCNTCSWNTGLGKTKCNSGSTGCVSGYAMRSSDGECYQCPDRCTQCTDTGSQTECDYDYCVAKSAYKKVDKTCPSCPDNCDVCYVDQSENVVCTMCADRYVATDNGLSCVSCPSNCYYCEYNSDTGTSLCYDEQCADGYYRTDAGICSQCSTGCKKCSLEEGSSQTSCSECKDGYAHRTDVTPNTCVQCRDCSGTCTWSVGNLRAECGQCKDEFAPHSDGTCRGCPNGCKTCTTDGSTETCVPAGCLTGYAQVTSTRCIACMDGATGCDFSSSEFSASGCGDGYVAHGDVCLPCPDNCIDCTFDSTSATTTCTNCAEKYTESGNVCVACQTGCTRCDTNGAGKCDGTSFCPSGYVLDGDTCAACATNCVGCTTKNTCDGSGSCAQGFKPDGTTKCDSCPNNCLTCPTDVNVCTSCEMGYALVTGGAECRKCPNNCRFCSIDGGGTKCNWGQCEAGYTMKGDFSCESCPAGCGSCYYEGTTLKCHANSCKIGYVQDPSDDSCKACPPSCEVCRLDGGATKCAATGCKIGYYFNNAQSCVACATVTGVANCMECDSGSCDDCNSGFSLVSGVCKDCSVYDGPSGACETCDADKCLTCNTNHHVNDTGYCEDCATRYFADCTACSSTLCSDCSNGFTLAGDFSACHDCSGYSDCAKCDGNDCTECNTGFILNSTKICEDCTVVTGLAECIQCTNDEATPAYQCEECASQFTLSTDKSECYNCSAIDEFCSECDSTSCSACLTGYVLDGGSCITCDAHLSITNCAECSNTACTKCDANYMINDDGCGLVCSVGDEYLTTAPACVEEQGSNNDCIVGVINAEGGTAQDVCYDTFCREAFVWTGTACTACPSNCEACYYDGSSAVCMYSGCKRYYGRKDDGTCGDCPLGCERCSYDSGTNSLVCDTCKGTYVNVPGPQCVECHDGCAQCAVSTQNEIKCSAAQCMDEYTQVTTSDLSCFPNPNKCKTGVYTTTSGASYSDCSLNQCVDGYAMNSADKTCHGCPARCTKCHYDATVSDTVCDVEKCEDGSAQNPTTYACIACPARCDVCTYNASATSSVSCLVGGCEMGSREHFVDGVVTCGECLSNCDVCEVDPNNVLSTICLDQQCEIKYGINKDRGCTGCSDGCDRCDISNDGQPTCTSCSAGYASDGSGSCVACPDFCTSCTYNSGTAVTVCDSGACRTGYAQNTGSSILACEACPDKCTQCTYETSTSSTHCVTDKCETGYDNADGGTCGACSANCETCITAGPDKCDDCVSGYRVSSEKVCEKCSSFCSQCNSAGKGKCDSNKCDSRYTLDDNSECKGCAQFCTQCSSNGPSKCDTNKCDSEYAYTGSTQTCIKCPDNCHECDVASDGTTTECKNTRCYTSYGLKSTDKKCHKCPNDCTACEDTDSNGVLKCTNCASYFILNNGVCGSCPINCKTCSYVSEEGLRCSACKEGYTFDSDNNCVACPSNCAKCAWNAASGRSVCNDGECAEGYGKDDIGSCKICSSLVYAACSKCTDTVEGNSSTTKSVCTECAAGYTMADNNLACLTCQISSTSNCATCYDRPGKYCTDCSSPAVLSANKEICGFTCHKCSGANCKTFTSIPTADLQSEVCDACWVASRTENGVETHARGCNAYNTTTMCTDTFQAQQCRTVNGVEECARCCTGANCNDFDITAAGAERMTPVCVGVLLLAVLVHALF